MANVGGVGQQLSFNFDANAKRNAQVGMGSNNTALKKKVEEQEGQQKLDSQSNVRSSRDAQGLTTTELEGQTVTTSASGVELTENDDGSFSLRLPTGYSLAGNADGKLVASDQNNQPLKVAVEETDQGPIYSFNDAAGNKVDVDPVTLDFGFADPNGNVSQLVRGDGSQVVVTRSQYRDPGTREHSEIQTVTHFGPDGTVEAEDGVRVSNSSVGFQLPTGAQVEYDLPYPVAGTLRQQAPEAPQPQPQAQPDKVSLGENGEAATPLFLQEPGFTAGPEQAQAPESKEAGSGVMRTELPDGRSITQLPNGMHLVSGDQPAAADSFGNQFEVNKDLGSYSFSDSKGNTYSLSDDSLAFKVTNKAGDVTQVVHEDGTTVTTAREGNQLHRWESKPGEPQVGVDGRLDVPNRGSVELPYWVPGQPGVQRAPYASVPLETQAPPPPNKAGGVKTSAASGVTRELLDDGRIKTSLPNGINLVDGEGHTPVASDARGNNFEVQTTQHKAAGGPIEKRYTFTDSSGNKYTMFSDSMDFAVESPDSAVRQVVRPDGRILNLVRDGNVTHWSEIDPANKSQAATRGTNISDANPGVINIPGRGAVPLPYRIPDPGTRFEATAGTEHLDSGMADKSMPGSNNQQQQATFTPHPGRPQQGFKPGLWDRIKSVFTGENPWAKYEQAPPDQMGAHRMGPQMGGPDQMGHMYHQPGGPPPSDMGPYPGQHTNYQYDPMTAGMMRQMESQDKMMNIMMMGTMATSMISMLAMPMMMFFSPGAFMF